MPFEKIETRRKSAYAAEQLISAIKNGAYKAGDRLPPERELAERMGISRPLVREALSALHLAGIIESRAGDGTYIRRSIGDIDLEEAVLSILEEDKDPMEVLEARTVLEKGIVELAAERVDPEDIEKMERILAWEGKAGVDRDYESYVKADRDFHLAIAAASQNSLLEAAVSPLIDSMGQRLWGGIDQLYLFSQPYITQTLDEHTQILNAIKQGDAKLAAEAMKRHLCNSKRRFVGDGLEGGDISGHENE